MENNTESPQNSPWKNYAISAALLIYIYGLGVALNHHVQNTRYEIIMSYSRIPCLTEAGKKEIVKRAQEELDQKKEWRIWIPYTKHPFRSIENLPIIVDTDCIKMETRSRGIKV